jgi:hypothetical protein
MRGFGFVLRCFTLDCAIYVMPSDATNSSDYAGSCTALPTLYELGPPTVSSVLFRFHPSIRSFRPGYIALKSKSCVLSKSVSVQLFPGHNYERKKKPSIPSLTTRPSRPVHPVSDAVCLPLIYAPPDSLATTLSRQPTCP